MSLLDIKPDAITKPNANKTPKSLTDPIGLKLTFFVISRGKTNILASCSSSKIPKIASDAKKTRREIAISRRSRVITIESESRTNKSIAIKLSGAPQAPIKLPI